MSGDNRISLIGGTGQEGRGLALRLAMAGLEVTIGSRSLERAISAANNVNTLLGTDYVIGALNSDAIAGTEINLLAVPFPTAADIIAIHNEDFRDGSVLIDATVPVAFDKGEVRYIDLPEGSGSEHLRGQLKDTVNLVTAFKTIPAHLLNEFHEPLDCDDFIAGDSDEAKAIVIETLRHVQGLRPLDAGPLRNAGAIERMTVLAIQINRRYKVKMSRYRIVGL